MRGGGLSLENIVTLINQYSPTKEPVESVIVIIIKIKNLTIYVSFDLVPFTFVTNINYDMEIDNTTLFV